MTPGGATLDPSGDRKVVVPGSRAWQEGIAVADDDFEATVETYRRALATFVKGDPGQVLELVSLRDDVTLANPLGPPRLGRSGVEKAIIEVASHFTDGSVRCEQVSSYATPELGYVVQIERYEVRLPDQEETSPSTLRATMIFRREEGTWRVVHRHADTITTPQPIHTVLDT
ncbi:YybH family protein [Actinomycetospora straminea]|uniref:SnoaL-like domain-containing protein n=1 Tax=Actinomycetospora straminea TaxID=663607 RepID=A0ABP9EQ64_9PSEU|nr:nuclear transport factor 2 family protein [Actinomycetospora straminea]MDD7936713.1 nuclear transport factor 2 family protein [Actinomycetospora straminea]